MVEHSGTSDSGGVIRVSIFDMTGFVDIVIVLVDNDGPSVAGDLVAVLADYRLKMYQVSRDTAHRAVHKGPGRSPVRPSDHEFVGVDRECRHRPAVSRQADPYLRLQSHYDAVACSLSVLLPTIEEPSIAQRRPS